MDPLQRLLAIEEIRALKARYCRFLDTRNWDGFAALFTRDAEMDVSQDTGNPPVRGVDAILAQVRFAVDHAATSHQVHTPEIELDGPDDAHGTWAMQDRVVWQAGKAPLPGTVCITGYGQYHERGASRTGGRSPRCACHDFTSTSIQPDCQPEEG